MGTGPGRWGESLLLPQLTVSKSETAVPKGARNRFVCIVRPSDALYTGSGAQR